MLHIVRNADVARSAMGLCVDASNYSKACVSRIDHLAQRTSIGYQDYETVAALIKADDVRRTDAALITDKAPIEDIVALVSSVDCPVLIMSGDPKTLRETLGKLTAYIELPDREIVPWQDKQ